MNALEKYDIRLVYDVKYTEKENLWCFFDIALF